MTQRLYPTSTFSTDEETAISDDNSARNYPRKRESLVASSDCCAISNRSTLVTAFLASLAAGGNAYSFGLYGAELKTTLGLTQTALDTISTAYFLAGLVSGGTGYFVDRCGPRRALIAGGTLCSILQALYWAIATQRIMIPSADTTEDSSTIVRVLSFISIMISVANSMVTGAVFKSIVSSTRPGTSGLAVGAAKGFVGLGSGAYACWFALLRRHGQSSLDFLLLVAVLGVSFVVLPSMMLRTPAATTTVAPKPSSQTKTSKAQQHEPEADEFATLSGATLVRDESTPVHYYVLFTCLAVMIGIILSQVWAGLTATANLHTPLTEYQLLSKALQKCGKALLLFLVWLGSLSLFYVLPKRLEEQPTLDLTLPQETSDFRSMAETSKLLAKSDEMREEGYDTVIYLFDKDKADVLIYDNDKVHLEEPTQDANLNLCRLLQTLPAYLLLWTATILVGAGTTVTNNMGQMVESLVAADEESTPTSHLTAACLALFSVAQSLSRVFTGVVSEGLLHGYGSYNFGPVPRTVFWILSSILAVGANTLLSQAEPGELGKFAGGIALSGLSFGMVWPLLVLCVGDLFGTTTLGANYMFYDGFTSAIGTVLLSKVLTQAVYEAHSVPIAPMHHARDHVRACVGSACFRTTFIVIAVMAVTCVGASMGVVALTLHRYRRRKITESSSVV